MASSDFIGRVRVERIVPLGLTMRRVTFGPEGEPQPQAERPRGGHCNLFFPELLDTTRLRPRAFTYRRWHSDGRFDVDFAVHGGSGPAAAWLRQAEEGQSLSWRHGGPAKISLAQPSAGSATLVVDATALPVAASLIEEAHFDRVIRLLLLPGATLPLPDIAKRDRVETLRVRTMGEAKVRLREITSSSDLLFAACEASDMRLLRRLALDELGLDVHRVVTSGYWKAGHTTEEVNVAKSMPEWFADPLGGASALSAKLVTS